MNKKPILGPALAALALAVAGTAAHAQTILKVHHFLPSSSNAHQNIITPWCEKVSKESNGELKCQIYPAMQLGGNPGQLVDQARDGVADIVWAVPTYAAGRYAKTEVFELPFMAINAKQGSQALWEYTQKFSLDEFKGVKPIFMHTTEGYVLHSNKQVTKMEQLRGMKIRTATRISAKMVAGLGGTPVQMPLPQVPDALSKGVVDGVLVPWEAMPATKLYEIVKYHLDAPLGSPRFANSIFLFGMNQAKYDSLPANLKKVIDDNSGLATSAWAGEKGFDAMVEPFSKLARDRGNTITVIPATELGRWEQATANVDDDWMKEVAAKGGDGKKLIAEAKALLQKYAK
ncbi:MAG TPA: TRAP transporter substrate-binding protein [Burkholderiaceae bacterium]|nr:TRAP transporter substrate-binding protein [Burkholderiaceae bacterium]